MPLTAELEPRQQLSSQTDGNLITEAFQRNNAINFVAALPLFVSIYTIRLLPYFAENVYVLFRNRIHAVAK